MRPDTQLTFIAPSSRGEQELFGGHSRQGGQEKRCSHVGNCVHGKWVSETHVFWGQERDGDSKLCRALAICILCKYLSVCYFFLKSILQKQTEGEEGDGRGEGRK